MARSLVGVRIREQRRNLNIRQADLARRVGISPSYMNLIERNKRGIAGTLLRKIGEELGLSIEALTGTAEQRLESELIELARDPERGDPAMDGALAGELIGRFPAWARALGRINRRELAARAEVAALSDRLTHDPFLSQAVHAMLTDIAALRSTADILTDVHDIDAADRDRFQQNISALAQRLAETGSSLAEYFDQADIQAAAGQTDIDLLEDFLSTGDIHLQHAETMGTGLPVSPPQAPTAGPAETDRHFSSTGRNWRRTRDHIRTHHLAQLLRTWQDTTHAKPASVAPPVSVAPPASVAPPTIVDCLLDRATDAAIAPMPDFANLAEQVSWDLPRLCRIHDGETGLVFRRMTAIPGWRLAYLHVDASGRTLKRLGALDQLPRHYDAACPWWAVHTARLHPGQAICQLVRFPEGLERLFIAMADANTAESYQLSGDSAQLPAALYQALHPLASSQPVGATCRLCAHADCTLRREPPVVDLAVSPLQSG